MKLALIAALAMPMAAAAHPHTYTEQQAGLILSADTAALRITIIPSEDEGPAIFAMLDTDGSGTASKDEMRAFAETVLGATSLTIDGIAATLQIATVNLPNRAGVEQGMVPIEITTVSVPADLSAGLALTAGFDALSPDWTIQPWTEGDFGPIDIARSDDGRTVSVTASSRNL